MRLRAAFLIVRVVITSHLAHALSGIDLVLLHASAFRIYNIIFFSDGFNLPAYHYPKISCSALQTDVIESASALDLLTTAPAWRRQVHFSLSFTTLSQNRNLNTTNN